MLAPGPHTGEKLVRALANRNDALLLLRKALAYHSLVLWSAKQSNSEHKPMAEPGLVVAKSRYGRVHVLLQSKRLLAPAIPCAGLCADLNCYMSLSNLSGLARGAARLLDHCDVQ